MFLIKTSRTMIRANALELDWLLLQRLVLALLKQDNVRVASQGLKFLDTFIYLKQHSAVLHALLRSEKKSIVRVVCGRWIYPSRFTPFIHHTT
jgi:hypothetical protein